MQPFLFLLLLMISCCNLGIPSEIIALWTSQREVFVYVFLRFNTASNRQAVKLVELLHRLEF